jgi:glycosyltransferase involved in cell wall biosynthesis
VGRLIEKKGFADLIEACRILRERGLDFECRIVGEGPLGDALREQIARANLSDAVFLDGPRTQAELAPLFARASLFALACAREAGGGMDNLPTVIAEAMSCALPVVSTRLAGVPEMVADGESGFLVSEKNPGELADATAKILANPVQAGRFGKRGRELAEQKFSIEITTRELRKLIESVS